MSSSRKQKYIVTIRLETSDRSDRLMDKICAMFSAKPHRIRVRKAFPGFGTTAVKQLTEDNLIEIGVKEFDYRERHYVEEEVAGNSIGVTFKERPTVENITCGVVGKRSTRR